MYIGTKAKFVLVQFYIYLPKILDLKSRAKEITAMFNIPCEVSEFYTVSKIVAKQYS